MSTTRVTAYQYVADAIRRQILEQKLAPQTRLPPERQLCERYNASRITIRRALQILADERLIERRQGLGTFVAPAPSRRIPLLNTDFSGSMAAHAPDLERGLDHSEWQAADHEVSALLLTYPGARMLFARRIDLLRAQPVAYDEIYLPEPVANRLDENDLTELRFLERWQAVQQLSLTHLTQRIEAIAAEPQHCEHLRIRPGEPLLKEVDVFFSATGSPCGLFVSYYRHDLFQLTSTVQLRIPAEKREQE